MSTNKTYQKISGELAIVAGVFAFLSLIVGLMGVNWDFEVFSDPTTLIASGTRAAGFIKWSHWLNMLGNYFLLFPLALILYRWLKPNNELSAQIFTASGLVYMLLGAAGAAILAAARPYLIDQYAQATAAQQGLLILDFQLVNAIAEAGLQGVLQNLAGAIWFAGMGFLLRQKKSGLAVFAIAIGIFLLLNTIGNMFNVEALSLIGLTANILLGPVWSILIGIAVMRAEM